MYSILSPQPQAPVKVVRGAIATILVDNLFSIGTEEAKQCLNTAQILMQQFSRPTEIEKSLASWMTDRLRKIIQKSKCGTGDEARCNQEKLWQQFHKFVSAKEYKNKWEFFLKEAVAEVDINPLLYQHIADEALANLLKREYGEGYEEECCSAETSAKLTYEEENVVRYIGGYVLRALKKDPSRKDVSNILDKMIDRTPLRECSPSQTIH